MYGMQTLEACKMARYDAKSGNLYMTDLGRIASHFYIQHVSIETINEHFKPLMRTEDIFHLMAMCSEFESLKVRDEEVPDLEKLKDRYCQVAVKDNLTNREGKVQVLIQVRLTH
jgi:activating signal cointegrator complex subunit 3